MDLRRLVFAAVGTMMLQTATMAADVVPAFTPKATDRMVVLGDSITDGFTYGQIITQALREAKKPIPSIICAGVASDTAPQMAARVETSVLRFKPQLVTFSAGTNDALRGITPEQYEKALREVVAKVKDQGGTMILLTPCMILSKRGKTPEEQEANAKAADARLDEYEAIIRKVAAEEKFPVAENRARMQEAVKAGKEIMSGDGIHPNYLGQSLMARAILDAIGYAAVDLPKEFQPPMFPGVINEWKMRLAPLDDKKKPVPLTADSVKDLAPDDTWVTYKLPEPVPADKPSAEDWWEQERRNGFAHHLQEVVGKGLIQAVADLERDTEKQVFINTGIGVETVWFNGDKIHQQGAWTGFHAGKERLPVTLKKGTNRIVVEINGNDFFLSVTDQLVWEEALR